MVAVWATWGYFSMGTVRGWSSPGIPSLNQTLDFEMSHLHWRIPHHRIHLLRQTQIDVVRWPIPDGIRSRMHHARSTNIIGSFVDWHVLSWILGCLPILFMGGSFLLPESPVWLISKGRHQEAQRSQRDEY